VRFCRGFNTNNKIRQTAKRNRNRKIKKKTKCHIWQKKATEKQTMGLTETLVDSEDTNGNPLYSGWEENLPPPRWLYQV